MATARYIRPNWPDVQTWQLAMINFGYGARGSHSPENQTYFGTQWTSEKVSSRGPLGALYRVWGDGKQMSPGDLTDYFGLSGFTAEELRAKGYNVWTPPQEKGSFISEGDTPTLMNLLHNGLRAYEDGSWGGWGGRRRGDAAIGMGRGGPVTPASPDDPGVALGLAPAGSSANVPASSPPAEGVAATGRGQNAAAESGRGARGGGGAGRGGQQMPPQTAMVNARFFAAAQNDFAARLKWSVTPRFKDANHEPSVKLSGALGLQARPGETVNLSGAVSDPDGNEVTIRWWQYVDAGSYPGEVTIADASLARTSFRVPDDAMAGQTIHIILEGRDDGTPALTRYQRLIVTVSR